MQNSDSLTFKTFRARYFLHKNAWRVNSNSEASFLWKSLLEGRADVLQGGL